MKESTAMAIEVQEAFREFSDEVVRNRKEDLQAIAKVCNGFEGWLKIEFVQDAASLSNLGAPACGTFVDDLRWAAWTVTY